MANNTENEQLIYFIGIVLPEPLNTQVSRLIWRLYDENNPNMLKPLVPHVTLLSPPMVRGILPEELIPRVQDAARPYLPLNIELSDIDFYGEQVCYIKAESLSIHSLYEKLIGVLPFRAQAQQRRYQFSPHLTLAQVKHPGALDKPHIMKEIMQNIHLPIRFEVDSLTYFKRIYPRVYAPHNINEK